MSGDRPTGARPFPSRRPLFPASESRALCEDATGHLLSSSPAGSWKRQQSPLPVLPKWIPNLATSLRLQNPILSGQDLSPQPLPTGFLTSTPAHPGPSPNSQESCKSGDVTPRLRVSPSFPSHLQ